MRNTITAALYLASSCVAVVAVTQSLGADVKEARLIKWADRSWEIKVGQALGPGPNNWSGEKDCIRVDDQGHLHMAISPQGNAWNCSELIAPKSLGYGEYRWIFSADFASLSPRSVLGLFLYEDDEHEIDFELSQWGKSDAPNAQFVLQPSSKNSIHRFSSGKADLLSCSMLWGKSKVRFRCWIGDDMSKKPLAEWTYSGEKVPKPGKERVHLNFWLVKGKAAPDGTRQEVIIKSFDFKPAPSSGGRASS